MEQEGHDHLPGSVRKLMYSRYNYKYLTEKVFPELISWYKLPKNKITSKFFFILIITIITIITQEIYTKMSIVNSNMQSVNRINIF